uniref:Uncharacterized protein n=1 Tax=Arundo donax TaxID=35708 RepID=A0A0A9GJC9_ARUDO
MLHNRTIFRYIYIKRETTQKEYYILNFISIFLKKVH